MDMGLVLFFRMEDTGFDLKEKADALCGTAAYTLYIGIIAYISLCV
jgi:hypothetical protein